MESTAKPESVIEPEPGTRKPRIGLSGKLLLLTIVFVMVAEILIYVGRCPHGCARPRRGAERHGA
jgi:hypothetical protein